MMNYPRHRIYEAIVKIKNPGIWRLVAPAAPMTEAEFEAFQTFCQMWSRIWGCTQHDFIADSQNSRQENEYVIGHE